MYNREFLNIDTEEKAYFLGLMYADGCIYQDGNCCTITLQYQDRGLLEQIQKIFPFFELKNRVKKTLNNAIYCELYKTNKSLKADFVKNGCYPLKSGKYKNLLFLPNIDESLIHHFIRGYFDGDGSIYPMKYRNLWRFEICSSSEKFIEMVYKYFTKHNIQVELRKRDKDKNKLAKSDLFVVTCHISVELYKLKKLLYKDSTISMKRKKDKFDLVVPLISSREYSVKYDTSRNLICPYCNSTHVTKRGKRLMNYGYAYRYICENCKKFHTLKEGINESNKKVKVIHPDFISDFNNN